MPTALATLRAPLDADPSVVLSTSKRIRIDQHDEVLPDNEHTRAPVASSGPLDGRDFGNLLLEQQVNLIGEPSTVMFRRADVDPETFFSVRGMRYAALVDFVLWLNLLTRGRCYYTVEPLSCYRQHEQQMGQEGRVVVIDKIEWLQLLVDVPALGYLQDPHQEARALRHRLHGVLSDPRTGDPTAGQQPLLTAMVPVVARLAELHRQVAAEGGTRIEQMRASYGGDPVAITAQVARGPSSPALRASAAGTSRVTAPSPRTAERPLATRSENGPATGAAVNVSILLAASRSTTSALGALGSAVTQAGGDAEVFILDAGAADDHDVLRLGDLPGDVTVESVAGVDPESAWEKAVARATGDVVLFLSDDVMLADGCLDALVAAVLGTDGQLASPLLIGPAGTGVSSDLTGFGSVCLAGTRASLVGDDPLDLLLVSGARATTDLVED
jgi:hypothetical protein